MKFKKWIVYSLLLSFFVLLTPRTIWHDCDQDSHSHISKNDDLEHDFKFKGKFFNSFKINILFLSDKEELIILFNDFSTKNFH